uniref:Chitin-binding type-2 domain-containing protein n=1 Tax=Anopheles farauti TaxID=69004 RepID=A0A182QCL8_9DIPT
MIQRVLYSVLLGVALSLVPGCSANLTDLCTGVRFGAFPHPTDCRQYVMCLLWTPVVVPCPSGYVYHPGVQFCVQESQYRCEVGTTPGPTSTTTPEPTTTTTAECVDRPSWESFFCDDVRRAFAPNPMNCTQYISCRSNPPRNLPCRVGTIFNDLYQDCLPGDDHTCTMAGVNGDFCTGRADGSYSHPFLCNRFVTCVREQGRLESCPPFYVFDPRLTFCVKRNAVECSSLLQ